MADGKIIDMPAGSGKTYSISEQVNSFYRDNPTAQVLCITYTNRAVEELQNKINAGNCYISTIHTFINDLISPFFKNTEVIDKYFECFASDIEDKLINPNARPKSNKQKSYENRRHRYYESFHEEMTLKSVKHHVTSRGLKYGQTPYSSWLYGRLGHDDLLKFAEYMMESFPKLKLKISRRFQLIIIDEYQDTSEDVIRSFFNAVRGTSTQLFLYGDSMQQIYQEYSPEFSGFMNQYKERTGMIENHRSNSNIVHLLNNLYNDDNREQKVSKDSNIPKSDFYPRIIITDKGEEENEIDKLVAKNPSLILYLFNAKRYDHIGAKGLFDAYRKMDKYNFGKEVQVKDVLLNDDAKNNPDKLMSFLVMMYQMQVMWGNKKFGLVYESIRSDSKFNLMVDLKRLADKNTFRERWDSIFKKLSESESSKSKVTIREIYEDMNKNHLLSEEFLKDVGEDSDMYSEVFDVQFAEVEKLERTLSNPSVSTQHGVKGESHDSIIFVAENSEQYRPYVNMKDFFKLISTTDVSLQRFYDFTKKYSLYLKDVDREKVKRNCEYGKCEAEKIRKNFMDNPFFNCVYQENYSAYIANPIKKNLKHVFETTKVERILAAYKLFYVGCSRARRNLTVLVTPDLIEGVEKEFEDKFKKIGFSVTSSAAVNGSC